MERPRVSICPNRAAKILDAIALVGLIVSIAIAAFNWSSLPDIIPIHFGINGRADNWGSKLILWMFPFLNLAIFVSFTFLRRYPHTFNYPVKITPHNAEVQYASAINLLNLLKAEFAWLFVWIEWQIINSSKAIVPQLDPSWLLIFILLILGSTVFYIYQSWQNH